MLERVTGQHASRCRGSRRLRAASATGSACSPRSRLRLARLNARGLADEILPPRARAPDTRSASRARLTIPPVELRPRSRRLAPARGGQPYRPFAPHEVPRRTPLWLRRLDLGGGAGGEVGCTAVELGDTTPRDMDLASVPAQSLRRFPAENVSTARAGAPLLTVDRARARPLRYPSQPASCRGHHLVMEKRRPRGPADRQPSRARLGPPPRRLVCSRVPASRFLRPLSTRRGAGRLCPRAAGVVRSPSIDQSCPLLGDPAARRAGRAFTSRRRSGCRDVPSTRRRAEPARAIPTEPDRSGSR